MDTLDRKFDIIIDDGPHTLKSQIEFLKLYRNILKPNGILIIEDLQKWGRLGFLPLMLNTPLTYKISLYDLRESKSPNDDLIYSARKTEQLEIINRVKIAFIIFLSIFTEVPKMLTRFINSRFKAILYRY